MPSYNYSSYFSNMVSNQNLILSHLDKISLYIECILFIFVTYFIYQFIKTLFFGGKA